MNTTPTNENIEMYHEMRNHAIDQARLDLERARLQGEEVEKREKEAKEKEEEAKRLADESKQAALDAQKRELEANARVLETQKREAEAEKAADEARKREEQSGRRKKSLSYRKREFDPEKLHFQVGVSASGSSGSGKSSLVNAFRGLKNNSLHAARTGVVETTMAITRYPQRVAIQTFRLYFNQQGLFIFDIIVLVYDSESRFTQIDVSIIQNCERFKIPIFIVRSKADMHIKNIMQDLGYDENDEDADFGDYQRRARQLLIDNTRKDLEDNLRKTELSKHDVFIVSGNVIFSLVTAKGHKKTTPAIDEAHLVETILNMALTRRYGTQASASVKNHSTPVKENLVRLSF